MAQHLMTAWPRGVVAVGEAVELGADPGPISAMIHLSVERPPRQFLTRCSIMAIEGD